MLLSSFGETANDLILDYYSNRHDFEKNIFPSSMEKNDAAIIDIS